MALPLVIQGGMGIAVSNWRLANAVSSLGQLGVVSGTALDSVLVRRLQDGDIGGHVRRALEHFPWPGVAAEALRRYYLPEGREEDEPYALLPMLRVPIGHWRQQLLALANFVEVWLAREGHDGRVGINLLTKVQLPTLASLYGAMLAGVDYVLMGAGIPREIPGALDAMADHEPAALKLIIEGAVPAVAADVARANGAGGDSVRVVDDLLRFDPASLWPEPPTTALRRPNFLPIVSASSLAQMLVRRSNGRVDGFVVEGPTAGGHNAPPRGSPTYNDRGEPMYGDRDEADLEAMRALGLPFWIAGGAGSPAALQAALAAGAAGIQVGTLFAYSDESGIDARYKREVLARVARGEADVFTDPRASPTGFPFKVVQLEGTNSDPKQYAARERVCDLGYLRNPYINARGRLDYRCSAEPVDTYVKKGGAREDTCERKCLCNALMADVGLAQVRDGEAERALITSGDDLLNVGEFLGGREGYGAGEVVEYLLGGACITPLVSESP